MRLSMVFIAVCVFVVVPIGVRAESDECGPLSPELCDDYEANDTVTAPTVVGDENKETEGAIGLDDIVQTTGTTTEVVDYGFGNKILRFQEGSSIIEILDDYPYSAQEDKPTVEAIGGTIKAVVYGGRDFSRSNDRDYIGESVSFIIPANLWSKFSLLFGVTVNDSPLMGVGTNFYVFPTGIGSGGARSYELLDNHVQVVPKFGGRLIIDKTFQVDLLIGPEMEAALSPVALGIELEATYFIKSFEIKALYSGRYFDNVDVTQGRVGAFWNVHNNFAFGPFVRYQYTDTVEDDGRQAIDGGLQSRSCFGQGGRYCVGAGFGYGQNGGNIFLLGRIDF